MAKILYLTTRLPIPATDGRALTMNQWLDIMSVKHDLYLVSLNQGNKKIEDQPYYLKKVICLDYPKKFEKISNCLVKSLILRKPFQCSVVYSKKSQKKFDQVLFDIKPDIIICDMIRLSDYVIKSKYKTKTILDMNDILSLRYLRAIKMRSDSIGQYKDSMSSKISKLLKNRFVINLVNKMEFKRMKRAEEILPSKFNGTVLLSPLECKKYNERMGKNVATLWPVCVKKVYDVVNIYNKNQLCFLGNMDYAPNQITLEYILKNILPKIPNMKLKVVGIASKDTINKYKDYENVEFTGIVDSVVPYVQESLCLLAPIQYGTGIKTKILESMSFGVPVITTPIGAEGLLAKNGEDIFVTNEIDEMISFIEKLNDDSVRNKISHNGIKYIKNNHIYEVGEKIINTYLDTI
ncbi:MAG: glycosyltransferase [Bacilli bacterium]